MRRLPLVLKSIGAIGAVLVVAAIAQRFLLRWAIAAELGYLEAHGIPTSFSSELVGQLRPKLILAIGLPLAASAVGAGGVFAMMVRARGLPLVAALNRIAAGSFDAPLPEAPDRDFVAIRDAFEAMRLALDRAVKRLAHADAQRRRLFADLAHELATPTSAVLGLAETLARPELCPAEADRADLARLLEDEATRIARLVDDIRDLAELDDPDVSFAREAADLAPIVARAAGRFRGEPRVEVEVEGVIAAVDAARIDQVVGNLLTNARRHTPPDGKVAVSLRARAGSAVITVADSGPGVPDEVLAKLGERLFRADPSRDRRTGGHGLGLSIVRAIVRRHEGEITFGRAPLGGLLVTITLAGPPS